MDERGHLLDLIYETVLEPLLWITVIERLADYLGGNSGWLSQISVEDGQGLGLPARIDPAMTQRYLDYYGTLNFFAIKPRPGEYMSGWAPRITTEVDYLPREALARNEYYHDFMLPEDMHSVLTIDLAAKGLDISSINIHRGAKCDPFGRDEIVFARGLYPHLVRAFKLGEQFSTMRGLSNCRAAALDQIGQGILILDAQSRIRHANHAAERLLNSCNGLCVVEGRLTAAQSAVARKLEALIGIAASPDDEVRRGGSMTVPTLGRFLSVTVVPLSSEELPLPISGPSVLISIADTRPDEAIVSSKLEELFALTAAEVRVALALLGGATPRGAAQKFRVSLSTIRSQMASIFGKTGTSGQAELSRLMVRLAK